VGHSLGAEAFVSFDAQAVMLLTTRGRRGWLGDRGRGLEQGQF
jgi:hypothetical protein